MNSIFLIISLFKICNIYKSLFYLSPINNSFNIAICKSNLISLDSKFMFKYSLNKFPISFIIFNLIIVLISMCITLSCIEFFSLNINDNDNFLSNFIENKKENFFNIFFSFLFFIIRNIYKTYCIKSFLGKLLFFFWGIIGILISSLFIYYINNFIKFSVEEKDAYSKLTKLLKPINKEHKASNLIKLLLLLKKIISDNQNTEKDYKLKKEDLNKRKTIQRRPIFQRNGFGSNISSNNLNNLNDKNKNEEKKKFIKYIEKKFVFKMKFIVEYKNFIDNLKVARNSSQSFKDVLKTVGNKMKTNINQLNNKIEILIQNDRKFSNFINFTSKTVKNIKKINEYHNSILQYFIEIHNEYVKQMIGLKKETENNSAIIYRNLTHFKKMKSNVSGYFNNKKKNPSKFINDNIKQKKVKSKKDLYDLKNVNFSVKKQRSSMLSSLHLTNTNLEEKIKQARSKQATNKSNKSRNKQKNKVNKRTKSLDDWKFMRNELKEKLKGRISSTKKVGRSYSEK